MALPWLHPASIWYQTQRSSLDFGGLHRAEGKPQVWLPALPTVEEPMQGFQLQNSKSIFKREMMQMFPSSLACVHARKGQFYLGALRVTSLSFSSSQCCCLKRAIARSLSESQSHFWGVSGMGTEMLFWRDKYQRWSHCPQVMGQGPGHSWQQRQLLFCPSRPHP